MAGLWLKDGLHLNITNQLAKELAGKMQKGISVLFLGSEVIAVKTRLLRSYGKTQEQPQKATKIFS